ncbi:FixH family protein [Bdellovibrio sp. SKB1291214]|uniref:FixH family protein n=1 Tax=Bdellovibrio sp. SKB1291214 TaxID=1732569 RepID=UPI000B51D97A|nr:FixH family protein [Bdellovibrio sp. SKB1291214]UYL08511.1 FixH family protein [Bdellovibrio sp. SKB1291214]
MKLLVSVITLIASITLTSAAHAQTFGAPASPKAGELSPIVCSASIQDLCVQLLYKTDITSVDEGQFQVLVQGFDGAPLENFKVDLWMQMGHHGHGSSPVEIIENANGVYLVTKAWFVMSGKWNVRIDFTLNGQAHHLEIPVYVQ